MSTPYCFRVAWAHRRLLLGALSAARCAAASPILIAQGTTDSDVPVGATDGLVSQLCNLGHRIDYRRYDGLDHEGVVSGSLSDVTKWINDRFEGRDTADTCAAVSAPA